jgi:hypothetical protein
MRQVSSGRNSLAGDEDETVSLFDSNLESSQPQNIRWSRKFLFLLAASISPVLGPFLLACCDTLRTLTVSSHGCLRRKLFRDD